MKLFAVIECAETWGSAVFYIVWVRSCKILSAVQEVYDMRVIDFLQENKSSLRVGLPIELLDLISGLGSYSGSYEVLVEQLEKVGLEHVRNARFVMEDTENGQNKIVLLYMKDLDKYEDFDLRQCAYKIQRLEGLEQDNRLVDDVLEDAGGRAGKKEVCRMAEKGMEI